MNSNRPYRNQHLSLFLLFVLGVLTAFTLAGCGDSSTGTDMDEDEDNGDSDGIEVVSMTAQSFSPANIEVVVGTTVRWENNSSVIHTVTSGTDGNHDGEFNSGDVASGESFQYQFNEAGNFDYYCVPHLQAGMTGSVTVVPNGADSGNSGGNGSGY